MSGWLSMHTAPTDGTHVIVFCERLGEVGEAKYDRAFGWMISAFNGSGPYRSQPSAWQPMPAPPSDTEKSQDQSS